MGRMQEEESVGSVKVVGGRVSRYSESITFSCWSSRGTPWGVS